MINLNELNHGYLSYSGLTTWQDCPHKFKMKYVEKVKLNSDSIYNHYGKIMHSILEDYFEVGKTQKKFIAEALEKWKIDYEAKWQDDFIDPKFHLKEKDKDIFYKQGIVTIKTKLPKLQKAIEKKFGKFAIVKKEQELTTPLYNCVNMMSKIDLIIHILKTDTYAVIDYKAVKDMSKWKRPPDVKFHQANIYEENVAQNKKELEPKENLTSHFLIIPRVNPKEPMTFIDNNLPMVKTSNWVNNMVFGIEHEIFFTNRKSCFLCEYKNTEHCP